MNKIYLSLLLTFGMVGCQSLPTPTEQPKTSTEKPTKPKEIHTPTGVVIKPYDAEEIKRKSVELPSSPQTTPAPPQVLIPKQPQVRQSFDDGSNVPAVKGLIQQAETALSQKQIDRAESLTLQAQRLAPQSAQTYLLLTKIALIKNNKPSAISLAQRGLSFAQDESVKKQLNAIIQQAK